jgi:hypothetical protein
MKLYRALSAIAGLFIVSAGIVQATITLARPTWP